MVLPGGWVWVGTPGEGCTIYSGALLECIPVSTLIYISPTI
jgi:hypothetical protein